MEEIYLRDRGGIVPNADDVLTDELVTYLDGVNTVLGGKEDPRFGEYQNFLNSISEAAILEITPEQMSSGKYDDLDLTGEEDVVYDDVSVTAFFPQIKNENDNEAISSYFENIVFATMFSNNGIVVDKDYVPVIESQMTLPHFKEI